MQGHHLDRRLDRHGGSPPHRYHPDHDPAYDRPTRTDPTHRAFAHTRRGIGHSNSEHQNEDHHHPVIQHHLATQPQPQPPMHMHVPPKGHGPHRPIKVPTFVPAQGKYDDLGRTLFDGFGVGVQGGSTGVAVGGAGGKGKVGREGVVDFWKRLDWGDSGSGSGSASASGSGSGLGSTVSTSTSTSTSMISNAHHAIKTGTTSRLQPGHPDHSPNETSTSSLSRPNEPYSKSTSGPTTSTTTSSSSSSSRNLIVPRSEWFIRKALLAKAKKEAMEAEERGRVKREMEVGGTVDEDEDEDEKKEVGGISSNGDGSGSTSLNDPASSNTSKQPPDRPENKGPPPPNRTKSSSLASLLSLPPPGEKPYEPPTHFHIRPDNVGWKLLTKGGWTGTGGLGRPEGWQEATRRVKKEAEDAQEVKRESVGEGIEGKAVVIDVDEVIDLTELDDDDEVRPIDLDDPGAGPSRFGEQQLVLADLESRGTSTTSLIGPGRVAPVATYLKNDLAGIGHIPQHRRSVLKPHVRKDQAEGEGRSSSTMKKRVTHTSADIRAMQRGKVVPGLSEEDLEKKRRGRAKREAKRDREERKRWMQIISA